METASYATHFVLDIVDSVATVLELWLLYLGLKFIKTIFKSIAKNFKSPTYKERFRNNFKESFCYQIASCAKHKFCAVLAVMLLPVVIVITKPYILHALNINIMEFGMGSPCYYYATIEYGNKKMIGTAQIEIESIHEEWEDSVGKTRIISEAYVHLSSVEANGRKIIFREQNGDNDAIGFNRYKNLEATDGKNYRCFVTVFQDASKTTSVLKNMDTFSIVISVLCIVLVCIGGTSYVISAFFAKRQTEIQERERVFQYSALRRLAIKLAIPGTLILGSLYSWVGDGVSNYVGPLCTSLIFPLLIIFLLNSRVKDKE